MITIINIEGKEMSILFKTRFQLNLTSYETLTKIHFEKTSLCTISKELVSFIISYPLGYFQC